MNKQALIDIDKYNSMPETPEKKEINRRYINDEISSFEFYSLATEYMRNNKPKEESK